jgi:hypothetical protein
LSRSDESRRRRNVPRGEEFQELLLNKESYSFHRVEGLPALLRKETIVQEDLAVGDKVTVFRLPDGKYFISKTGSGDVQAFTIGKITPAHIYFDDKITIEEK